MDKVTQKVTFNAEVMWANLHVRNEMSGKYQVDLTQLSKAAVEKLEELGITVKHKDEVGFFITCKSDKYPIVAQLPDGTQLKEDIKVGNGSKARCTIEPYAWTFKNKKGKSASLRKLVITDLKVFSPDSDDGEVVDEGSIEEMESDVL